MRVLILFISLITIVSCSKELSLLDKCIASNSKDIGKVDILNTWRTYDEYKKMYDFHIDDYIQGNIGLPTLYRYYIDKDFVSKSYKEDERSFMSLTKTEQQIYLDIFWLETPLDKQSYEEVTESVKTLNANLFKLNRLEAEKICNKQGIY